MSIKEKFKNIQKSVNLGAIPSETPVYKGIKYAVEKISNKAKDFKKDFIKRAAEQSEKYYSQPGYFMEKGKKVPEVQKKSVEQQTREDLKANQGIR